ncbi:hypothetical protein ABIB95_004777 [Bradyrhizobium sp. LA2.1]
MSPGPACSGCIRTTSRRSRSLLRERRCCPKTATPIELRWPISIRGGKIKVGRNQKRKRTQGLASRLCFQRFRADLKLACLRRDAGRYYQVKARARCEEIGNVEESNSLLDISLPQTKKRRILCFQSRHSKPGAFIAQIAAMKMVFARGRIVNVSAAAVSGQTVMLTRRGQRNVVSAYNADGTTKWPTTRIVSQAGPSSA